MGVMDLRSANSPLREVVLTNRVVNPAVTLLQGATGYWDVANYTSGSQTLPNRGTGGTALDAQLGSTSSVDSNDPQYLPYSGTPYVYLPGINNNNMTVTRTAAFTASASVVITVKFTPDGNDSTYTGLLGLSSSYRLIRAPGANLVRFDVWRPGIVTLTATLTTPVGTAVWVRATYTAATGVQTIDESTDGITWTQRATQNSGAAALATPTDTNVEFGSRDSGSAGYQGRLHRGIIVVDGSTVLDVDTSVLTSGSATSFTAVTGQTVTINRSSSGRKAVAVVRPVMLFGTDDYLEVPDNDLLDFTGSEPLTEVVAYRAWGSTANQTISAKKADATTAAGYQFDTGTGGTAPRFVIADGTLSTTATGPTKTAGVGSIVAVVRDVAADTITVYTGATAGTPVTDTTTATLANSGVSRVGRLAGAGTAYLDAEFLFRGTFRRALSASEISLLATYAASRMP